MLSRVRRGLVGLLVAGQTNEIELAWEIPHDSAMHALKFECAE